MPKYLFVKTNLHIFAAAFNNNVQNVQVAMIHATK